MEYTLSDISPYLDDPVSLVYWMSTHGFVHVNNIPCSHCNTILRLQSFAHSLDGCCLRCPNWRCRRFTGVRHGSFFTASNISITAQIQLLILFCGDSTMASAARLTHLARSTVIRFFDRCRETWRDDLTFDPIVFRDNGEYEVDECFIRRVYDPATNLIGDVWIQGVYERATQQLLLQRVPDRSANSLLPVIFQRIPVGSWVYTDEYVVYRQLDIGFTTYVHMGVNHSRAEYARTETLTDGTLVNVHINTLEGMFRVVRSRLAYRARRNTHRVDLILSEYMFRFSNRSLFDSFRM
jgi:hypothetical protein